MNLHYLGIGRSSGPKDFGKKSVLIHFAKLQESSCSRDSFLIVFQASDLQFY